MPDVSLPTPVQRAIDAVNASDTDAFLASFTESSTVDDWGRKFTGPNAIRGWSDNELIGMQATLDVTGVQKHGDSVTVSTQVGGKGFNGPSDFAFTLEGDHIALMRITG